MWKASVIDHKVLKASYIMEIKAYDTQTSDISIIQFKMQTKNTFHSLWKTNVIAQKVW